MHTVAVVIGGGGGIQAQQQRGLGRRQQRYFMDRHLVTGGLESPQISCQMRGDQRGRGRCKHRAVCGQHQLAAGVVHRQQQRRAVQPVPAEVRAEAHTPADTVRRRGHRFGQPPPQVARARASMVQPADVQTGTLHRQRNRFGRRHFNVERHPRREPGFDTAGLRGQRLVTIKNTQPRLACQHRQPGQQTRYAALALGGHLQRKNPGLGGYAVGPGKRQQLRIRPGQRRQACMGVKPESFAAAGLRTALSQRRPDVLTQRRQQHAGPQAMGLTGQVGATAQHHHAVGRGHLHGVALHAQHRAGIGLHRRCDGLRRAHQQELLAGENLGPRQRIEIRVRSEIQRAHHPGQAGCSAGKVQCSQIGRACGQPHVFARALLRRERESAVVQVFQQCLKAGQAFLVALGVQAQGGLVGSNGKTALPHDAAGIDLGRHLMPGHAMRALAGQQRPGRRVQAGITRQQRVMEVDGQLPCRRDQSGGQHAQIGHAEQVVKVQPVQRQRGRVAHGQGANILRTGPAQNLRVV